MVGGAVGTGDVLPGLVFPGNPAPPGIGDKGWVPPSGFFGPVSMGGVDPGAGLFPGAGAGDAPAVEFAGGGPDGRAGSNIEKRGV